MRYVPQPNDRTPSQTEFIRHVAALPHPADNGPDAELNCSSLFGDAIRMAREIITRDKL